MTIHLRAIRAQSERQSDDRVLNRIREDNHDDLRAIIEQRKPLLHWPLKKKIKEAA